MKTYPVEETPLNMAVQAARDIGLLVNAPAQKQQDGSLVVSSESFVFSYVDGMVRVSGKGLDQCFHPSHYSIIKEALTRALEENGFVHTWVKYLC